MIGFDDCSLISELLNPKLTTIKLPYAKIEEKAASLLIAQIVVAKGRNKRAKLINQMIGLVILRNSVKNFL